MDDCNLDKLGVKPGKLEPAFKRDITEYNIIVASDVEKLSFDPLTSDTGASYSISGGEGGKQVPLPEGAVTDIKIEVTAEDGTTKKYFIHARRLSAKDATLSTLKLSIGKLDPEFSANITEYSSLLPCNITSLTVTPTAPDTKNAITVCGEKPGSPTPLSVGETQIPIEVTSADGSNKQTYTVTVMKKQLPRYVKLTDPQMALQYECPISLNPLYRPITIKNSDPRHTFSAPLIDEYTKTSKFDLLNSMPLGPDWRVTDHPLDSKLSTLTGCIPLTYGGASEVVKYGELGASVGKCNVTPKTEDLTDRFKGTTVTMTHTVEVRKWEKGLQQIFDETDVKELVKNAKAEVENYFQSLPKPGESKQYDEDESPVDFLNRASYNYATAIKFKPKDPDLHLQLGMVLEERYYAEDLFGFKKEQDSSDIPSFNVQAKESSKEEEALAIAKLRGVDATAPISLQLKAIDEEYHHLIDSGQSGKADHVMELYAWYSKKASQEGAAALKAGNDRNPLGQAYMKYLDAMTLDETKAVFNFHVGRLLVVQGNYEDAVKRLEVTLNWNAKHQLAKIYLGLALALQKGGPGSRAKEAITYLQEAVETLLTENSKFALSDEENIVLGSLHAENLIRLTNVHLLRAVIQLGRLLTANPDVKDTLSAQDVFHNAALLSSQVLPTLCRGDTYKQVEWVLLDAHSLLLRSASQSGQESVIAQRCERLSALIVHSTIPQNSELLNLQERTCQQLVQIQPCSSPALYILGAAQLAKFENSPPGEAANKLLEDAKASFKSCMELEGKPASGEPGEMLTGQQWWQEKLKAEEERRKAAQPKTEAKPAAGGARGGTRGGAAGRGAPAARGRGAATRGGAAASRGAGARGASTAPGRGAARGAPAGRGAPAAKAGAPAAKSGSSGTLKPAASKSGHDTCVTNSTAPASTVKPAPPTADSPAPKPAPSNAKSAPINGKMYHPRLGLARALRASGDTQEAQKYYTEVISVAPGVHDAYIESAEMLTKTDPLAAVDIFAKFPVPDEPSFDDAYIFGEIVRLLMKNEKYDDPRLAPNMIVYGHILGLGSLEKYVNKLEELFKAELLKTVYAGVNRKEVDDPDLQAFFKFKCWI
ncbi:uncharacterized protein LOC124123872 isoform X1 [Haliotis rufescens]|uniref:uncharacterized protein LOC124123872 isoform X1 n=1 Tax=Haliotis rufescens TaxID=6454 RepID=UPI00201F101E|nr:uncharacterized protein LOC124123872 isoform X1 [Haliotis rufescens]